MRKRRPASPAPKSERAEPRRHYAYRENWRVRWQREILSPPERRIDRTDLYRTLILG